MMKKQLLFLVMMMLPLVASAHDIEVKNADGVTIYYNYIKDGTELAVTYYGNEESSQKYKGNVVIPEEVTYMNRTRKVTCIYPYAFLKCSALTSVTIPNSVLYIGQSAFERCTALTSISIPNSVTYIGPDAFKYCSGLASITIPNSVTSIDYGTFRYCSGLTSVTIPNSVTSIGWNAFRECTSLTSVTIPNSVTSIGEGAFQGCLSLSSITIPNSVTSIGGDTFNGCSGLTSVTIPNSVTSIGQRAFKDCSKLSSVTIPNSVTSIGSSSFNGANILTVNSLIENPFIIRGSTSDNSSFSLNTFYNATLYVPTGTIEKYKATEGWKDFKYIEEIGTPPTPQKCEKPTISYNNGKLTFTSSTEGATCYYSITDSDIKAGSGNEVQLAVTYNISVYAAKAGCENSETATATLCWIDQQPKTEGITNGVAQIDARPVLVKTDNGFITVEGADDRTNVTVYTTDGKQVGSAISQNNIATIATSIQPGSIAIVKVGDKAVKVVIK